MDKIELLKKWVGESCRIVAFTGAGVSTESGIKDFRSADGLYNETRWTNIQTSTESGIPDFRSVDGLYSQKFEYPPERIISHSFFLKDPGYFYRFYRDKMLPLTCVPNVTHRVLSSWEKDGKLSGIITQNIDGLHQKAGSSNVVELHGSIYRNFCMKCGRGYSAEFVKSSAGVPRCSCGGMIKPDVVLYEEALDQSLIEKSVLLLRNADLLIVAGTSLTVYPAAGLINYYRGSRLVLINKDKTPYDAQSDLVLHQSLGTVFSIFESNC